MQLKALSIGVKDGEESYSRSEAIEAFNGSSRNRSIWVASYWLEASDRGHTSIFLWSRSSSSRDCGLGSHLRFVQLVGREGHW